jgi:hypothetical protein
MPQVSDNVDEFMLALVGSPKGGWLAVWLADGTSHVLPLDDAIRHAESPICPCAPTYDEGVYVHHAADRREEGEPDHRAPQ